MADREKVIKALQIHADGCGCRSHYCDAMDCPYRYGDESCDIEEMCRDALALLKEQETRVMTVDEVGSWVMIDRVDRAPIVVEVRNRFIAWIISDEYYDLPECNLSSEFYGKTWRCWTTRPTDEQRKTVKWE